MKMSLEQMRAKGFAEVNGVYRKVSTITDADFPENRATENRKVKNARKVEDSGMVFDSRLEHYLFRILLGAGVTFERQKVYVVQEKFRFNREAVIAIKTIVDFWLPEHNLILDPKGHYNSESRLKYKLLKRLLQTESEKTGVPPPRIEMPKNREQCDLLLNRILFEK